MRQQRVAFKMISEPNKSALRMTSAPPDLFALGNDGNGERLWEVVETLKNCAAMLMQAIDACDRQERNRIEDAGNFYALVDAFEAQLITDALRRTNGNQTRAAKLLGLKVTTLNTKIKQLRRSVTSMILRPELQGPSHKSRG